MVATSGLPQALWFITCILLYILASGSLLPWRSAMASGLDVFMNSCLLVIVVLCSHFRIDDGFQNEDLTVITIVLVFFPLSQFSVLLANSFKERVKDYQRGGGVEDDLTLERRRETVVGVAASLALGSNEETVMKLFQSIPTADRMMLESCARILKSEIHAKQPREFYFQRLLDPDSGLVGVGEDKAPPPPKGVDEGRPPKVSADEGQQKVLDRKETSTTVASENGSKVVDEGRPPKGYAWVLVPADVLPRVEPCVEGSPPEDNARAPLTPRTNKADPAPLTPRSWSGAIPTQREQLEMLQSETPR